MTLPTPRLRFLPVDRAVLEHAHERRAFVTVPLDWRDPALGNIDIFYRILPRHDVPLERDAAPLVVVINGGPGIPSSFYRPLDFDYGTRKPAPGNLDRFAFLLRDFRVLIADQRGTEGCSAPLDMDDPALDGHAVARLFSGDSVARDTLAIIERVVAPGEPFFVIGQSYGGLPTMHYLALPDTRVPTGVVFSSSALPFEDPIENMRYRRREQLRLNLHLRDVAPDIEARLARTRAHVRSLGLDPGLLHGLFVGLGKGVEGEWEPAFVRRLDKIDGQTRDELERDMLLGLEVPHLLNYILSSSNFSPGHTDRTMARIGSRELPFEPWMIDEHELLMRIGTDGTWRDAFVDAMDENPPAFVRTPPLEDLRAAIGRTHALFTVADNDAMVPREAYEKWLAPFLVEGHSEVAYLPGGHNAVFLEAGSGVFKVWAERLLTGAATRR